MTTISSSAYACAPRAFTKWGANDKRVPTKRLGHHYSVKDVPKQQSRFSFFYSINEVANLDVTMLNCDGVLVLDADINASSFKNNQIKIEGLSSYWTSLDGKHVAVVGLGDVGVSVMFWIPIIEAFRSSGAQSVSYEFRESRGLGLDILDR